MTNEGSTAPSTAPNTPFQPPQRQPMKMAELTAIKPGAACASAIILTNSSSLIQCFRSTISRWMSGNMAYPPPSVNVPILKYVRNSCRNTYLSFNCCFTNLASILMAALLCPPCGTMRSAYLLHGSINCSCIGLSTRW